MTLSDLRQLANDALAKHKTASQALKTEKAALVKLKHREANSREAGRIIQVVAAAVQTKAHSQIAGVVGRCLRAVFHDPYEFKINFERKRGKTYAELIFVRDGHELDPVTEAGMGVVDVASFALRISCLMLATPRRRRLIVADEPFKNVNGEVYQERVGRMVEMLAEEMDVQFVIVTDDDWLKIGKVITISQSGTSS